MEIKAGSALDFTQLGSVSDQGKPVPAGTFGFVRIGDSGKFVFTRRPQAPVRFFAASFGVSHASGALPDASASKRLALQLRRAGYNLARFHMVDAVLMNRTGANLVFDAVQLDRLHALLAALKDQGIYWMFDGLSSPMGGYSNSTVDKNRDQWAPSPFNVKAGIYTSAKYRQHFKALARQLFTTVNPYTGQSIIDDPALAGIVLVNEGGIDFAVFRMGSATDRAALALPFNQWLKARYGSDAALSRAWGPAGAEPFDPAKESLALDNIRFPIDIYSPSPRNIDAQKFFIEREAETAQWMMAFFRAAPALGGLGYAGPLTSLNNWMTLQANLSRSQFPWIDLHAYFADPSRFADSGSALRQVSALYDPTPGLGPDGAPQRSLGYLQFLASNRHAGKPFSVSEYSHVFWNAWRREALALAAYASLQDWDMICQFNEPVIPVQATGSAVPIRHRAIYPYGIALDPIAKATETLAALLFLRGDVASSRHPVVFQIGAANFLPPNSSMGDAGGLRYPVAALSLLTRIGVSPDVTTPGQASTASIERLPTSWRGPVAPIRITGTETIGELLASLTRAGVLPKNGRTSLANGVYESDTGQLLLRARERSLSIVTARTEALAFDARPPAQLGHLAVETFDTAAVVALSTLDGRNLDDSRRMLLTVSTDAINSGMTFRVVDDRGVSTLKPGEQTAESERQVLQDLGHLPVLLKSTRMRLKIRNANAASLAIYALALNGERNAELHALHDVVDGSLVVDIDTEKTPTTYFEITAPGRP